jgi:hypothetical protein
VIPSHNESGVLPPFLGNDPAAHAAMAPYRVSLLELVNRFATTQERINILTGFIAYRDALRKIGFLNGFQWVDGSFVESVETTLRRPPSDMDIVTFSYRPAGCDDAATWMNLVGSRPDLFDPQQSKSRYLCDAYFVDLSLGKPAYLIAQTKYWFGLFSHQRDTLLWKGMLEIPLTNDDSDVAALLSS